MHPGVAEDPLQQPRTESRAARRLGVIVLVVGALVLAGSVIAFKLWRRGTIVAEATFDPGIAPFTLTVRKVPVPVTTAVLGGEASVLTLSGKPVRLRSPPLTQNRQVFRLKGYGMPKIGHPDDKGDLYARIEVQLPTELTPAEREHYEALEKLAGAAAKKHPAA